MAVKILTADEEAYIAEKKLKRDPTHDYTQDPGFKLFIKNLTNKILDGIFPRNVDVENKEALMYLQKHPTKKLECGEDCLLLFQPLDKVKFKACLKNVGYEHNKRKTDEDVNKNYCNYYLNNITKLDEIYKLIDEIMEKETKPFKIAFDCGFVVEDTKEISYSLSHPSVQYLGKNVPMTIRSPSDVQLFKHLTFTTLGSYTSEVHAVSAGSRYHYVAMHTILFQVTRFGGGGIRFMVPGYDFLVKNKYIRDYGNENNLCMFYVVANSNK